MDFSRRNLLLGAGATGLTSLLSKASALTKSSLRVAHMTDFHVQPELGAAKGMDLALQHAMQNHPDLVLCGGDCIMDGAAQDQTRTALQWKIFKDLIDKHCKMPVHYTLGNHDVWGWNKKDSHTTGSEAEWGKKWFCDNFGYKETFHTFDRGAWHFVILDNILETTDSFNGALGAAQLEWLDADLATTTKPTLVVTHIPLVSVTTLVGSYNAQANEWRIGGDDLTRDLGTTMSIFAKHPHVKIALCGHEHMVDRVDYKGISYLCGGAVCGNWWKNVYNGFAPGYRVFDLHDDGTFSEQYIAWGWNESFLTA